MAIQFHLCSFVYIALAAFCVVTVVDGQKGGKDRNGKKGGWTSKSPKWANKGNGEKKHGHGGGRGRKPPPDASIAACDGKQVKADCSWTNRRQHKIEGMCRLTKDGQKLHCPPARDHKHKDRNRGGKPGNQMREAKFNSSVDACDGKALEEECVFRPPVWGDQEAEGFKPEPNGKNMRGGRGRANWKGRRGPPKGGRSERPGVCVPMNQTDGVTTTTLSFCRVLPSDSATDACNTSEVDDKCSFLTNGTDTYINLQAFTGQQPQAETQGDIVASFFVHGEWTDPEIFIEGGSVQGASNSKVFVLAGWPARVTLTTWSNDAWCFWKVIVNDTIILEDPQGPKGSDAYLQETADGSKSFKDSRFWIEGPPSSQIFDVPKDLVGRRLASTSISLNVYTAASTEAGTTGTVFVSFLVDRKWTESEEFFTGATSGEQKSKHFTLNGWPAKLWIGTDSSDAYSYQKITINGKEVIDDPSGFGGNSQDYDPVALGTFEEVQQFWIASPPSSQTIKIPKRVGLPEERNERRHKIQGTCQETWWDVMNGTLHCRPSRRKWTPGFRNSRHQGNKSRQNAMRPNFEIKSTEEARDPVKVEMIINNLDYSKLMADHRSKAQLTRKTQDVVATSAGDGVYPADVTVNFLPGSVIASCEVNPPAYVSRSHVKQQLQADASLPTALAAAAKSIPAVAAMATGTISVSTPTVVVMATTPKTSGVAASGSNEDDNLVMVLVIVCSASVACAMCMCVVAFCFWKKAKSKSADPVINGTTVAVGRPVTPGENNAAYQPPDNAAFDNNATTTGTPVVAATEPEPAKQTALPTKIIM